MQFWWVQNGVRLESDNLLTLLLWILQRNPPLRTFPHRIPDQQSHRSNRKWGKYNLILYHFILLSRSTIKCIQYGLTLTSSSCLLCSSSLTFSDTSLSSSLKVVAACFSFTFKYSSGFSYILTWILLLWGHGLTAMQLMQVSYGVATSTEVAYFTYIYANVAGEWYQQVTSFTRAALLLGRFLSGALSQSLICLELCDFRSLNYISLSMVSCATVISFLLPPVKNTIYFHSGDKSDVR